MQGNSEERMIRLHARHQNSFPRIWSTAKMYAGHTGPQSLSTQQCGHMNASQRHVKRGVTGDSNLGRGPHRQGCALGDKGSRHCPAVAHGQAPEAPRS